MIPVRDPLQLAREARLQAARRRRWVGQVAVEPDRCGHVRLVGLRLAVDRLAQRLRLRLDHRRALEVQGAGSLDGTLAADVGGLVRTGLLRRGLREARADPRGAVGSARRRVCDRLVHRLRSLGAVDLGRVFLRRRLGRRLRRRSLLRSRLRGRSRNGSRSGSRVGGRRVRGGRVRGRLGRRVDQRHDRVPGAGGECRAREEERRERDADCDPPRGDADVLAPVAGDLELLPPLPSHHGAQKRQGSREEERVQEALRVCPLWHCVAPFVSSAEAAASARIFLSLTSAAATDSRPVSASVHCASP